MTREEAIILFEKILVGAEGGLKRHPKEGKRVYGMRKELAEMALSALRPVSREKVERMKKEPTEGEYVELWEPTYTCPECGAVDVDKWNFCRNCGCPYTDDAVGTVMERLEVLKDAGD